MRKFSYIITMFALIFAACSGHQESESGGAVIRLLPPGFGPTRVVDADNLAVEQTVNTIAVFLAEPFSDAITHSYINTGFTTVGDYRLVTLPDEPAELGQKDIYVITNYGDVDLSSVTTVTDIRSLTTPRIDKNNNLDPLRGFCMYGSTYSFNFNSGSPAVVGVVRTCAKFRINMIFPEDFTDSPVNSFVVADAPEFTYIVDDLEDYQIPSDAYFNFANPIILQLDATGYYTNIAYVYESHEAPNIYFYTRMDGQQQEFTTALPVPERNYLYDMEVRVYEEETRGTALDKRYSYSTTVTAYDPQGIKVFTSADSGSFGY